MKRLFASFLPVAIAAVALVSCQKEMDPTQDAPETINITVHASVEDLDNTGATKTYIGSYGTQANTIIWGTGEYMKLGLASSTSNTSALFADSSAATADSNNGNNEAEFAFSFNLPPFSAPYTYVGMYPSSAAVASDNNNLTNYKVVLPSAQNATGTSYDPAAYIMIAQAQENQTDVGKNNWKAYFRRATALNKITLKNLPSGVSVNRVTITAPDGVYLAGGRYFNLLSGESGDIYSDGGRTETIAVNYASPLAGGADLDIWFTSWSATVPVGNHLIVTAYTTDSKIYTRDITVTGKAISFKEGYLNTLGVNMNGISPESAPSIPSGDYVILAKNGDSYYALYASGSAPMALNYSGSLVSYTGDESGIVWTVTKSGDNYTIENNGKYIGGGTGASARIEEPSSSWTTNDYLLDITWDSTNNCYFVSPHVSPTKFLAEHSPYSYFDFATSDSGGYNNIIFVPVTPIPTATVAQVFAGGAGSYNLNNLTVYDWFGDTDAFVGGDTGVFVGDDTGMMLMAIPKNNLPAVGTARGNSIISISNAIVSEYNGILAITSGEINLNSSGNDYIWPVATAINDVIQLYNEPGYHPVVWISGMIGMESESGSGSRIVSNSDPSFIVQLTQDAGNNGMEVCVSGYIFSRNSDQSFNIISTFLCPTDWMMGP